MKTSPTMPPGLRGGHLIVSVSGGRDSTATALHMLEAGLAFDAAFWDTGWEHEATYDYVERVLPGVLGRPVRVVAVETPELAPHLEAVAQDLERRFLNGRRSGMARLILHKAMFPTPIRSRWCTELLKHRAALQVAHEVIAADGMPVFALGIRGEESAARAKQASTERMGARPNYRSTPRTEMAPSLDAWVWRPILDWSAEDVAAVHVRHGVTPNPLYAAGAGRVGCWPCIGAGKQELRLLDERRVRCIEALETVVADEALRRGAVAGGAPAFFQRGTRDRDGRRPCTPIRQMVEWSHTDHGGRQMLLPGLGGCMSGLCER